MVDLKYSKIDISQSLAKELKSKGWLFDWSRYSNQFVIKLTVDNSDDIQGLIAYRDENGFTYVDLVESAPHNRGNSRKYKDIGLHLFAIAAQHSFESGHDGYIACKPKTKLYEYYVKILGAQPIPNGDLFLDSQASKKLIDSYIKGGRVDDKKAK